MTVIHYIKNCYPLTTICAEHTFGYDDLPTTGTSGVAAV